MYASAGEIQLSLNGKFLYVSNRDNSSPNQNRSSIAVFSISSQDGSLTHIQNADSGGMHPRYFTFDHTGKAILITNQNSNNIVWISVDDITGLIIENSTNVFVHPDLVGPTQVLLLPSLLASL